MGVAPGRGGGSCSSSLSVANMSFTVVVELMGSGFLQGDN